MGSKCSKCSESILIPTCLFPLSALGTQIPGQDDLERQVDGILVRAECVELLGPALRWFYRTVLRCCSSAHTTHAAHSRPTFAITRPTAPEARQLYPHAASQLHLPREHVGLASLQKHCQRIDQGGLLCRLWDGLSVCGECAHMPEGYEPALQLQLEAVGG